MSIQLNPQQNLMIWLCDKDFKKNKALIEEVIEKPIDWFSFFSETMKHKVLFICYENLKKLNLLNICLAKSNLPLLLLNHWEQLYEVNLEKNQAYMRSLKEVSKVFRDSNIKFAVAKGGPALISKVYTLSERKMYDIDLIANRSDYLKIDNALNSLGFFNANYDHDKGSYLKIENDEVRKWLLHTRGLPNYIKPIDAPYKHVLLQVQFMLGSTVTDELIEVSEIIEQANYSHDEIPVVSPQDLAIQLALHIYRETIEPSFKGWGMDWNLIKICDFDRYIDFYYEQYKDMSLLADRITNLDCVNPFLYAAVHTNAVYQSKGMSEIIEHLIRTSDSFTEDLFEKKDVFNMIFSLGMESTKLHSKWEKLMGIKTL